MASNLMDYLLWRGDLPFSPTAPWNELDALVMAMLCYNPLSDPRAATAEGVTLADMAPCLDLKERTGSVYFRQWRDVLYTAAGTRRFGSMVIHDYTDEVDSELAMQFSVLTADLGDGTCCVAFRGTDDTIAGWHEDFDMSYASPVPSQVRAVEYLERMAGCGMGIHVCGHSKGGNLAAYAAAFASPAVQDVLEDVCSFDGPGLDQAALESEGYLRVKPRLRSFIPQGSVVGLLLAYHTDYTVVHAQKVGIWQHDALSWQLNGPAFRVDETVDAGSAILCEGLHNWLSGITRQERHIFVETLFNAVNATRPQTINDIGDHLPAALAAMAGTMRKEDPQTRKLISDLIGRLLGETASAAWKHLTGRLEGAAANLFAPPEEIS